MIGAAGALISRSAAHQPTEPTFADLLVALEVPVRSIRQQFPAYFRFFRKRPVPTSRILGFSRATLHLESHQLDLRWEHLRVREPRRQRQLLASLAESGQQSPIVVVSKEGNANYLVIDGYKRIAALRQLGRDTVEATVWPMGEAEALLLSRSQRMSPQESALEQGWLLSGAALSYQALTAFCRRQGIGQTPPLASGQYHFEPGVEMQHDTSPHEVEVGGRKYKAQTASAVLCYSRMLFFQINPTFQRFDCKVFLTDAVRYMNGAPERIMIDNTHVVVLRGTYPLSCSGLNHFKGNAAVKPEASLAQNLLDGAKNFPQNRPIRR